MTMALSQSVFSRGLIDEIMYARNDTDIISKSASRLDNVLLMPQGGLRKFDEVVMQAHEYSDANIGRIYSIEGNNLLIYQISSTSILKMNLDTAYYEILSSFPARYNTRIAQYSGTIIFSGDISNWDLNTNVLTTSTVTPFIVNRKPLSVSQISDGTSQVIITKVTADSVPFVVGEKVRVRPAVVGSGGDYYFLAGGVHVLIPEGAPDIGGGWYYGYVQDGSQYGVTLTQNVSGTMYYGIESTSFYAGKYINDAINNIIIYQNRLCIQLVSQPSILYVSAIDNWANFINTDGGDTGAFRVDLSSQESPIIYNMLVYQSVLLLFTDKGIYGNLNVINSVFSIRNNSFSRLTTVPCSSTIIPIIYDSKVFYISNLYSVRSLSLSYSNGGQILDEDITLLCPSYFNSTTVANVPNALGIYTSGLDNIPRLSVLCNDRIMCYTSIASQNIQGWTSGFVYNTVNLFANMTPRILLKLGDYNRIAFLKTNNKLNFYAFFNGTQINAESIIYTNPISVRTTEDMLYQYKKIGRFWVYVYKTGLFTVNGTDYDPAIWQDGVEIVSPSTRIISDTINEGWDRIQSIEIVSPAGQDFTLLGVSMEVT